MGSYMDGQRVRRREAGRRKLAHKKLEWSDNRGVEFDCKARRSGEL